MIERKCTECPEMTEYTCSLCDLPICGTLCSPHVLHDCNGIPIVMPEELEKVEKSEVETLREAITKLDKAYQLASTRANEAENRERLNKRAIRAEKECGSLENQLSELRNLLGKVLDVITLPGHAFGGDDWERACLLSGRYCHPFMPHFLPGAITFEFKDVTEEEKAGRIIRPVVTIHPQRCDQEPTEDVEPDRAVYPIILPSRIRPQRKPWEDKSLLNRYSLPFMDSVYVWALEDENDSGAIVVMLSAHTTLKDAMVAPPACSQLEFWDGKKWVVQASNLDQYITISVPRSWAKRRLRQGPNNTIRTQEGDTIKRLIDEDEAVDKSCSEAMT